MKTEPVEQHLWLRKLVGEWTYENESSCLPNQPPMKFTGRESVRMLGNLWALAEMTGTMPDGSTMTALMTLGYDPVRQAFIGSWIGSPMAHMFVYEGQLSADGLTLPLNTIGPSFTDMSSMANYQDIISFTKDGKRTLTSQCQNPDGSWTQFMQATYTRES